MKKSLALLALLTWLAVPARASVTANLDAGELTAPVTMQFDNTVPSSNGSLLLLINLGTSNTIDTTLTPGNFVSGTNSILAAGGFNDNGGTNETLTTFNFTSAAVGSDLALLWFPQITYAQYQSGTLTLAGDYFGAYAPNPLGSTPDGGNTWTVPGNGSTISLDFYTSNSDGGGSQLPSAGHANFQIEGSEVPEPSTFALFGIGSLVLFWFARKSACCLRRS